MPPSSSGASPASARSSSPAPSTTAPPPRAHLRQGQLRRPPPRAPRVRALRLRARRLHRRPQAQARQVRARRRRHHLPRRDRRDAPAAAGQAPARPAGSRVRPPGLRPRHQGRRPRRRVHQQGPRARRRPGRLPRGPLLPPQRRQYPRPPLRDRPEEIPILAEHFWQKYSRQYNRALVPLSRDMLERFQIHPWPGNVRELENLVKRIVVLESEEFVTQELTGRGSGLAATNGVAGIRAEREQTAATALAEPPREEDVPAEADGVDAGCWPQGRGTPGGPRSGARGHQAGAGGGSLESGGGGTATRRSATRLCSTRSRCTSWRSRSQPEKNCPKLACDST